MSGRVINVGIIGCGYAAQVIHIPTLNDMYESFNITYLCAVSPSALEFCSRRVINHIPKTTLDAAAVCASPDVDVVFVLSADEFHPRHITLALKHGKHVFVEKPMAMTERDAHAILEAERISKGKVFVGFMRRYAAAFVDAIEEIGGLEKILYARVRDIIGPNSTFIDQSGTFPKHFSDYPKRNVEERAVLAKEVIAHGLERECHVEPTPDLITMYRALGGLGSHDLSAMREVLGMPDRVMGASFSLPFWNVLFKYPTFTVSYESGFHEIPFFDAHIEVYGTHKSVRVQYDTPFVKGLPITMLIRENVNGTFRETTVRRTYEDAFTLQMKELYASIVENKPIKTSAEDALQDLRIYQMIIQAGARND